MFKQTTAVLAASLAAFSFQTVRAEEAATAPIEAVAPEFSDAELTEMLGYMLAFNTGLKDMGFGPEDAEVIAKGLKQGLIDPQPSPDAMAMMPAFQQFMQARAQAAQAAAAAEAEKAAAVNIAAGKTFIESLKAEDAEVQTAESGLCFKILEPGAEEKPAMTDTVLVHYKGTLIDGTPFDSSADRGQPATFHSMVSSPASAKGSLKSAPVARLFSTFPVTSATATIRVPVVRSSQVIRWYSSVNSSK